MIYIVCKHNSNRLKYILDLFFNELLGISYILTTESIDKDIYLTYGNDSDADIPDFGLLWEKNIQTQASGLTIGNWNELPTFFNGESNHLIPFDMFSASFYLVSRYEEYLPYTPDVHNRFPPSASILVANQIIQYPIVNLWANELLNVLVSKFPQIHFKKRSFNYLSTIDIDMAWKYRNKGFLRNCGAILTDILQWQREKLKERFDIFLKKTEDPYYNFDYQEILHKQYETKRLYFLLLGGHGKFDKNTNAKNLAFRQLIRALDTKNKIGIHPSYGSNKSISILKQEVRTLENISGHNIDSSRQHFLMMTMPETYQNLISLGITEDYTLGYTSHSGFRAGIAADFYWFDLINDKQTNLRLYPFCHMDITPRHYEGKSIDEACKDLTSFMESVSRCGGFFSTLWHNESLSNSEQWRGWNRLYEHTLKEAHRLSKMQK